MDLTTRVGPPSCYPDSPDEFSRLAAHASDILDYHEARPASAIIGKIHVKDRKPKFKIGARAEWQRAEPPSIDSFGFEYVNHLSGKPPLAAEVKQVKQAVAGAAQTAQRRLSTVNVDDLKEDERVAAVRSRFDNARERATAALDNASGGTWSARAEVARQRLRQLQGQVVSRAKEAWTAFEQWTESRNASGDERATVLKAAYEAGTVDSVYEHRFDRSIAVQMHAVLGGPGNRAMGMGLRHDTDRRVMVGKCSTDKGVVGVSLMQMLGLNAAAGMEAFWVNEASDWSASAGVRYRFPPATPKEEPITVSAAMSKYGSVTAAWSIPVKSDLVVASRMSYEVANFNSSLQLGAQWRPLLPVFKRFRVNASMDPSKHGRVSVLYAHTDDIAFEGSISNTWSAASSGGTKLDLGVTMGV